MNHEESSAFRPSNSSSLPSCTFLSTLLVQAGLDEIFIYATFLVILLTIFIIIALMHLSLNLGTACSSWAHVDEFEVIIFQLEAVIAVKLVGHGIAA